MRGAAAPRRGHLAALSSLPESLLVRRSRSSPPPTAIAADPSHADDAAHRVSIPARAIAGSHRAYTQHVCSRNCGAYKKSAAFAQVT